MEVGKSSGSGWDVEGCGEKGEERRSGCGAGFVGRGMMGEVVGAVDVGKAGRKWCGGERHDEGEGARERVRVGSKEEGLGR